MPFSNPAATRAAISSRPDPATEAHRPSYPEPAPTLWRLSGTDRFAALRRTRHRTRSGPLRVSWVPGPSGSPPCVAFAVGKRVGPAVVRNRLRRRLRAILAEVGPPAGDYLVIADPDAAALPFSDLKALVSHALTALSPPPASPAP